MRGVLGKVRETKEVKVPIFSKELGHSQDGIKPSKTAPAAMVTVLKRWLQLQWLLCRRASTKDLKSDLIARYINEMNSLY